jgi:pyridoxine 4-dehydrogenase
MNALDAAKSDGFKIGSKFDVNSLGFHAMRMTGDGIRGEPKDRTEAIRTFKRLPETPTPKTSTPH